MTRVHATDQATLSRRSFLKSAALLGGSAAAFGFCAQFGLFPEADAIAGELVYTLHLPENQIHTVCQQCNTQCGVTAQFLDGRLVKLDGSPYSPWTMTPQIPYDTPLKDAATVDGSLCPKGYAGIQTYYDPYRIVKVLKRAGKRGENKWKTIPFDQAVTEIVQGGDLFGEGKVQGIKDVCTLNDAKLSAELAKDAQAVAAKKMTVDEFKTKHAANLHHLIDPNHPDFGPKNNQFLFSWGRMKGGRSEFTSRFVQAALGSTNYHGHTTVCQGSLYFTCKAMSDQFVEGKFTDGSKFYWQADTANSEFLLFVGASPFEANYGPPLRAGKVTNGLADGRMKIAVVDPRCSKAASRAWKWLPVEPNGVGALGMGLMRWVLENNKFNAKYLANANKAAMTEAKEQTWTQAAWLVKMKDDGAPGPLLRGADLGRPVEKRPKKKAEDGEWDFDAFVAVKDGAPLFFDPNDEKTPVVGELLFSGELPTPDGKTVKVKTVLQVLKDEAMKKSLAGYAGLAGVRESDIVELAREFTSHGRKAVCDIHRGVSQHTSGFYNVATYMTLNTLIGAHDWQGGLAKATTYNHAGTSENKPFNLTKSPKANKPWGLSIIRHGVAYDKTTLFTDYPAKRVFYPFASDIYQEIIPSLGDAYPYPIKIMLMYMATPVYSLPAGHALIEILRDPKKLPLFIASDITLGETSMYADYVFPDLTYLERWEFAGSHPSMTPKVGPFRQPAATPLTDVVNVFGEEQPLSFESLLLGIAEKMRLPAFGDNALGEGLHFKKMDDLYVRMVANLAFGDKPDGSETVPDASAEEIELFLKARRHLPKTIFDAERWKRLVGEKLWPKVVYVMNRGGCFQPYQAAYKDGRLTNKYGKMVGIYFDNLARTKHSQTGKTYVPHAALVDSPLDCLGKPLDDAQKGFDFTLITYKAITQTKSRTAGNHWLQAPYPENSIEMAASDAKRLGLKTGDVVRLVSASNPEGVWDLGPMGKRPVRGKVKVLEGLRPGVLAFSLGHGHWACGSSGFSIDGVDIAPDSRRSTGVHANAVMRLDPFLKNTGLVDTVGGSAVFYQTRARIEKA